MARIGSGGGVAKEDEKKKVASACDVEALKRCLEENKGDRVKCQHHIDVFRSSCSLDKPMLNPKKQRQQQ